MATLYKIALYAYLSLSNNNNPRGVLDVQTIKVIRVTPHWLIFRCSAAAIAGAGLAGEPWGVSILGMGHTVAGPEHAAPVAPSPNGFHPDALLVQNLEAYTVVQISSHQHNQPTQFHCQHGTVISM